MQGSRFAVDAGLLGLALWTAGFALGMALFPFVEIRYIGIPILIIMLPATIGVALWRFRSHPPTQMYAVAVGLVWTTIALVLDYLILVRGFQAEAYYDADVIVYYLSALLIPPAAAFLAGRRKAGLPAPSP